MSFSTPVALCLCNKQVIYLMDIFQNMNDYYRIRYDIKWHQ